MLQTTTRAQAATRTTTPTRLGGRTRKAVLTLHIGSAGVWLGMDLTFAVLLCTAMLTDNRTTEATAYQALELVAIYPMLTAGVLTLITGVILGIGSKYGLVRYWWVAVKLVINVLFLGLIIVGLGPSVRGVSEAGRMLAVDPTTVVPYQDLLGPLIVAPVLLVTATVLSVFKPWGRIRRAVSARR
jgi:hypothetical protein